MATYCIGDIHGCFQELQALLKLIKFDLKHDWLWFVGDLVNRGPASLEVLRFIKNLPQKIVVLGNHDLQVLTYYTKKIIPEWLQQAPDTPSLMHWLRHQKLLHYDQTYDTILVHAGIIPTWDLPEALQHASEVEALLHSKDYVALLEHLFGNTPKKWQDTLTSWERYRFIVNCFTRIRFCTVTGHLDFTCDGKIGTQPPNYVPWFKIPSRKTRAHNIVFGHWAALGGKVYEPKVFALDSGCVWGGSLTALRLDDNQRFTCQTIL